MGRRKKRHGHFCWCCARVLPNERFSGKNHPRHLCRECSKLPIAERAYRQQVRNIDRMLDWNGRVRRNQRASFARMVADREREHAAAAAEAEGDRWLLQSDHAWLAGFDPDEPEDGHGP